MLCPLAVLVILWENVFLYVLGTGGGSAGARRGTPSGQALLVQPMPQGHQEGQAPPDQGQVHERQGHSLRVSDGHCCQHGDLSPGPWHSLLFIQTRAACPLAATLAYMLLRNLPHGSTVSQTLNW